MTGCSALVFDDEKARANLFAALSDHGPAAVQLVWWEDARGLGMKLVAYVLEGTRFHRTQAAFIEARDIRAKVRGEA